MFETELNIGDEITNKELSTIFKCGNMSGMRKSNKTNTLVIVSDHTKGLYDDRWIDGVLHYTGMGTTGDQILKGNQNKTLYESNLNGVEVFLFEVFQSNKYIYMGQVKLCMDPYKEKQRDAKDQLRNVWIFPVKLVEGDIDKIIVSSEDYNRKKYNFEKKAMELSMDKLAEKAKENESKKPSVRSVKTRTYNRNAFVSEFAKRRANGKCQLCNEIAPFETKKGIPYLETHHIIWLSKGGTDTIENTVALCPNCHRKMHELNLKDDVSKLLQLN